MPRQKQPQQSRQKIRTDRRRNEDQTAHYDPVAEHPQRNVVRPSYEPIRARTSAQERYIGSIKSKTLTFATGPAGTGKTWVCASLAADALREKRIEKIIVTRPAVEAGESLGFLPGEMEEKFSHYLVPFEEVMVERLGTGAYEYHKRVGNIEGAPLAYMRGRTFKNCVVILDESQNTTPAQMKMFLTRIGEDCRAIINGDVKQKDIRGLSGLEDAINRLAWIPSVSVVDFSHKDAVRSGIVQEIIQSYETETA